MASGKPFWKTIPRTSLITFLLGVFFIFSIIGFASDIAVMGRQSPLRLLLNVLISGIFPVFYAVSGFALRKQFWKAMVPLFVVHLALINGIGVLLPDQPLMAADMARLQSRLSFDGLAITIAVAVGYVSFLYATITESRRYFRVHAEMELAAEIHRVLVPAIDAKLGSFQFYGYSSPSDEVGGDLIDVVGAESRWVAYLADVSGHGVAPGVVAGMVKSASRMLLSSAESSLHLQSRLNEVLYPLKKPDMFVTFCFVDCNAGRLHFGTAGHPAILHFSAKTKEVVQLERSNFPLGIMPDGEFATAEVRTEEGDVLALYTDGLLEAANAAGEEFGIKGLEIELQKHGHEPLNVICQSLQSSVARHGTQLDDQSVLLIRHSAPGN
jgi:serine phosphatase RsbU (regulator of sigma subunit)